MTKIPGLAIYLDTTEEEHDNLFDYNPAMKYKKAIAQKLLGA